MLNKWVLLISGAALFTNVMPAGAQHQGMTMPMPADTAAHKPVPKSKRTVKRSSKKIARKKSTAAAVNHHRMHPHAMTVADTMRMDGMKNPKAMAASPQQAAGMRAQSHDSMSMGQMKISSDSMKSSATPVVPGAMNMAGMSPAADSMSMSSTSGGMSKDEMMMLGPLGVSMERMGSGTTWIPDAVRMPSRYSVKGDWEIMAHGFAFAQYDKQSGARGDEQFGSLNWMMLMASRSLLGGHFQVRTMLSLDAVGVTAKGYPLLLQTGEEYNGVGLHDRQHPHDFWMELGALYQREFNSKLAWSIYAAPSGEPALGPVAFMHRPSAMDNPAAPISHHWQDATHVSFGAVTGGIFSRNWQMEASVFNGREPDQKRFNFDPIKLDSYSGRVTLNPTSNWSLAAGAGYLKSPEAMHPDESMVRYTASAIHGRKVGAGGQIASTLIWGANKHEGMGITQSMLAESEAIIDRKNTLFGRAEFVQKTGEDLVLEAVPGRLFGASSLNRKFSVGTLELGYIREIAKSHWATVGIGGAGTLNFVPSSLEPAYGSRTPTGLFLFLRLRPFFTGNSGMTSQPGMGMGR